ncbi:MAG: NFACT family protein, partial [Ignavibacteriae bacterium]|nr:NFACT family protein [Ignavibacteriota bacterium]
MFKNYFYLLRSIRELNKFILDTEILDCFSQEKNNLFFSIPTNDFPLRHLIISTNPNSPYIFIKNEHRKAKKNVVHFFPEVIHKRINNLTIAENDRIIKIQLENYNIYYSVR